MQHLFVGIILLHICSLHETFPLYRKGCNPNALCGCHVPTMSVTLPDKKQREAITAIANPSIMVRSNLSFTLLCYLRYCLHDSLT